MATSPRSRIITVGDIGWQEYQPGLSFKILWQDPTTKRRAQMTRFAPGAQLPLHRHVGDELIFVIEGAVSDESGTVSGAAAGSRRAARRPSGTTAGADRPPNRQPASGWPSRDPGVPGTACRAPETGFDAR